ncbi:TlpA family protein disulfide reductase [Nocardioides piscis]|uniref:TlpA family protein disulfide reductase n=1 Tax=Nocardioides piscis TaxID=2714938 RepID=A0A6G7YDD6_9ACTN|nr:TlpA disulfide reductase family protein [Nocardioides piscis]QIK74651.1 TlpA family protein disulfide reductase [Nocardioides piscis]
MIRLAAIVVLGALLATGCSAPADEPGVARLPDVTLAGFDGGDEVDLGELSGPTVISIWASWCGPCRGEMPVLQDFHESYGDRVPLLGIDYQDANTDEARQLVRDTGVTYRLVQDPGGDINGQAAIPSLRGLPYLAFVDEDKTVTHVEAVVIESVDELVDMVEKHLEVRL